MAVLSAEEVEPPAADAAQPKPQKGFPPLALSLGAREDAEAQQLRRAAELYEAGRARRSRGGRIFARYDSLEAKLGAAFAAWPASLDRIEQLGALYPRSALVQLHVGIARFWAGTGGAVTAWREARDVEPDTPYAVRAGDLLHPRLRARPARLRRRASPSGSRATRSPSSWQHCAADETRARPPPLRRRAAAARPAGVGAARVRPGAELAPNSVDALVADAVGRYTKEHPERGVLAARPADASLPAARRRVRFHLGVLLLWQGDVREANRQLRLAQAAAPASRLAPEAQRYLTRLANAGTG